MVGALVLLGSHADGRTGMVTNGGHGGPLVGQVGILRQVETLPTVGAAVVLVRLQA